MKLPRPNWSGDRAIGFVVGVGASFMFGATIATLKSLPAVLGLILILVGVYLPRLPQCD